MQTIVPSHWDDGGKPGSGFNRVRALQDLSDLVSRPLNNRVMNSISVATVNLNGNIQSTGIGAGPIAPQRYAETSVQARVTLKASAAGAFSVFLYRTTGSVPANGQGPNAGDVVVGGDAFGGGSLAAGVNTPATLAITDQELSATQQYSYYFAVSGPNGDTLSLINGSQLIVSEM
jgi:hypothetical protein